MVLNAINESYQNSWPGTFRSILKIFGNVFNVSFSFAKWSLISTLKERIQMLRMCDMFPSSQQIFDQDSSLLLGTCVGMPTCLRGSTGDGSHSTCSPRNRMSYVKTAKNRSGPFVVPFSSSQDDRMQSDGPEGRIHSLAADRLNRIPEL